MLRGRRCATPDNNAKKTISGGGGDRAGRSLRKGLPPPPFSGLCGPFLHCLNNPFSSFPLFLLSLPLTIHPVFPTLKYITFIDPEPRRPVKLVVKTLNRDHLSPCPHWVYTITSGSINFIQEDNFIMRLKWAGSTESTVGENAEKNAKPGALGVVNFG